MSRPLTILAISLGAAAAIGLPGASAQPRITNGRLTTQGTGAPLAQSFRTLVDGAADATWIAYSVPVVDGERVMCCFDSGTTFVNGDVVTADGSGCCGVCRIEPPADGSAMARRTAGNGPTVRLSGSERMAVFFRVVNRAVERIRVYSEDCSLDAGGRPVHWLEGVSPAESVALLERYAAVPAAEARDRIANGAITAIALHQDAAADAALARLVSPGQPDTIRRKVTFWLGNARGARGLSALERLLKDDASREVLKGAVFGVSQSRQARAFEVLVGVARTHERADIRGEAIFWLGQAAGAKAAAQISERIENDPATEVKKKAVFALSQLPKDEGVPLLIEVAKTNANPAVRKQAMFWLGQSRDPRAIDFFAQILSK
jgi:HEAT repeat protein